MNSYTTQIEDLFEELQGKYLKPETKKYIHMEMFKTDFIAAVAHAIEELRSSECRPDEMEDYLIDCDLADNIPFGFDMSDAMHETDFDALREIENFIVKIASEGNEEDVPEASDDEELSEEVGVEFCGADRACREVVVGRCDNCDEPLCRAHIAVMDILCLCEECNGLKASELHLLTTRKRMDAGDIVCMECHETIESVCDACQITNVKTKEEKIVCDECIEKFSESEWVEG